MARRCAQWTLLLLAAAIVIDGLFGPRTSAMNLAGVLPWTHWRGFIVLALLLAGNIFCWSCPFMLPRELAKKLRFDTWPWPHALRSKWLAVGLLVLFLWSYEALALWDSPWWTAWIILGYFGAAFTIDACFTGATFCKWVCPIGQFHFVESMCSPRAVAVRDEAVCRTCETHDCINGGPGGRGCGTGLYSPPSAEAWTAPGAWTAYMPARTTTLACCSAIPDPICCTRAGEAALVAFWIGQMPLRWSRCCSSAPS
jgi:polyferredoxin